MVTTTACARVDAYRHPCFYGSAAGRWGRVHLPVAPDCNVQCNFCNRAYDCANESRPAVTKAILKPSETPGYLTRLLRKRPEISVVGIAGPGDPFSEPRLTLETVRRVHDAFPNLLLCLSTNGLNVTDYLDDLVQAGVTHITVTMNAVDPSISRRIYSWVRAGSRVYRGDEGAHLILARQKDAITGLKAKGFTVKVNTVVIPGVNMDHVDHIAACAAELGADVMNCIPMIPVSGTPFGRLIEPSESEMECVREAAARYVPQMYHCRRCRADAAGLLGEKGGGKEKGNGIQ
jgi:nitrogen fixation protein NifB